MIKKSGGKYVVTNKSGTKNLSKPTTKEKATKRLQQVEYFKNKGKKK